MFRNDYSEVGALPVIEALKENALKRNVGYGVDDHSKRAEKLILKEFGLNLKNAEVHFLAGGTQTNTVGLSFFLRPFEGVIACDTGHINTHETGALEARGHKIYAVKNEDGKIKPEDIDKAMKLHHDEHVVKLSMVYISDATETGTTYTKKELLDIRKVCDKHNLLLFIDGARLGVALTIKDTDVDAKLIGKIADVFYVGGTKNGALYGEALVIKKNDKSDYFRYYIKNSGSMLAKGFNLGIQFETLFTNNLYFELAKNSNKQAEYIRNELEKLNVTLVGSSKSNQIFIEVKKSLANKLIKNFGVELWEDKDKYQIVRIVTSFNTQKEECEDLIDFIKKSL